MQALLKCNKMKMVEELPDEGGGFEERSAAARGGQGHQLKVRAVHPTRPMTWFMGVFCAVCWVLVFTGGIIVLIVYVVYRPHSPRFDVSSATLNAAYIDTGPSLNADLLVLANISNPNKKMRVEFIRMIIDFYYKSTLISSTHIEPFSAASARSRFASIHMVTSQVQLPPAEGQQLQEQMEKRRIIFHIKGVFRVRCNLGSIFRYSYTLYTRCTIMMSDPPAGALQASNCKTSQ